MVEQNKTPETGNEQFWQGLSSKSGYIQQEFIQSSEFLSLALGESEYGVAKHAPLEKKIKPKENEIYAFEPPAVLGGPQVIENMKKVDLFQYIPFVAQLDKFQVMLDIAKEVDRLGIKPKS